MSSLVIHAGINLGTLQKNTYFKKNAMIVNFIAIRHHHDFFRADNDFS